MTDDELNRLNAASADPSLTHIHSVNGLLQATSTLSALHNISPNRQQLPVSKNSD